MTRSVPRPQDIDDHLDRCLEGLTELGNTAQSIVEEAHHHREERINEILFTITLVTSFFTPANFIAGVVRGLLRLKWMRCLFRVWGSPFPSFH